MAQSPRSGPERLSDLGRSTRLLCPCVARSLVPCLGCFRRPQRDSTKKPERPHGSSVCWYRRGHRLFTAGPGTSGRSRAARPGQRAAGDWGRGRARVPWGGRRVLGALPASSPAGLTALRGVTPPPVPHPLWGLGPGFWAADRRPHRSALPTPRGLEQVGPQAAAGLGLPALVEGLRWTISTGPRTLWAVAPCPRGSPNGCPLLCSPRRGTGLLQRPGWAARRSTTLARPRPTPPPECHVVRQEQNCPSDGTPSPQECWVVPLPPAGRRQAGRHSEEPCFLNDLAGTKPGLAGGVVSEDPESPCPFRRPPNPDQLWGGTQPEGCQDRGRDHASAAGTQEGRPPAVTLAHRAFALAPHGRRAPQNDHLSSCSLHGPGDRVPVPAPAGQPDTAAHGLGLRKRTSTRDSRGALCQGLGPQAK